MLALSRSEGQSIIIDGIIEVKVVKWSRSSVRLAIQAPREVTIDRDEIWKRIHPGEKSPLERVELDRSKKPDSPSTSSDLSVVNPRAESSGTQTGVNHLRATLAAGATPLRSAVSHGHSSAPRML